ncbi:MAG: hypothetical protein NC082_00250 [Clostridiales bacterium]|nr:hypothetical protein [Clostridiales bacterium]
MKIPPIPSEYSEPRQEPEKLMPDLATISEVATDAETEIEEQEPNEEQDRSIAEEPAGEVVPGTPISREPAIDLEKLESLLAEAEQRGYKRGRNENIAAMMERPSDSDPLLPDIGPEPQVLILNNMRPSIWE